MQIQNNFQITIEQTLINIQNIVQANGNAMVQIQNNINLNNANLVNKLGVITEKLCAMFETWPWLPSYDATVEPTEPAESPSPLTKVPPEENEGEPI